MTLVTHYGCKTHVDIFRCGRWDENSNLSFFDSVYWTQINSVSLKSIQTACHDYNVFSIHCLID